MRSSFIALLCSVSASVALAEKPTLSWSPPPSTEDDRPLIKQLSVSPQGSDYAFKIEFDKPPFGDECKNRCANATLFIDTDNNKSTGLKLQDKGAPETGADLAVVVQGVREQRVKGPESMVKVKVRQFSEENTSIDQGSSVAEMDPHRDADRVLAEGTSVYLLVDTNVATDLPQGKKMRVVYHPPDQKPLTGSATGMAAPGASRIEMFKDGKLTNPVKKK